MKFYFNLLTVSLIFIVISCNTQLVKKEAPIKKPPIKTVVIDTFTVEVADSLRWLENHKNPYTIDWTQKQNEKTFEFLRSDTVAWNKTYDRLLELSEKTEWYHPRKLGSDEKGFFYVIYRRLPGEQQFKLLKLKSWDDQNPEILINPKEFRENNTAAISHLKASSDGQYLIYGMSYSGSDEVELRVKDLYQNSDLTDVISGFKYISTSWFGNEGFYYTGIKVADSTSLDNLYFHKLGTDSKTDKVLFQIKEKGLSISCSATKNQKYLFMYYNQGTNPENKIWFRRLESDTGWVKLVDNFEASYSIIKVIDNIAYCLTNNSAPKKKLIAINLDKPENQNWRLVIPEDKNLIDDIDIVNERFIVSYLSNACHKIKTFDYQGNFIENIALPTTGTVYGIGGREEDTEMFIGFTSYSYPFSTLRYDFNDKSLTVFKTEIADFDASQFSVKQIFYQSLDGTDIPMFIVARTDIKLDGNNPTILYGYGGFNISMTPWFSNFISEWVNTGGVYAVANLRGGGEYGQPWHEAGMLNKKQFVYDDFITAAKELYRQNYTTPSKLAIMGGSNGGLLVAACMTQRPDLFGAVVCQVPVIDMIRFKHLGAGMYWTGEYGDADNPSQFGFMYRYDPLINIRQLIYPPTLITTADTDDRVDPGHAKKFGEKLISHQIGDNPILIRIETEAGHGYGKSKNKSVIESTDTITFLYKTIGNQ